MPPLEQTTPPALDANPNPDQPASGDPAVQGDPSTPPATPPARPEGLPDSFWDEKVGVRVDELVTNYNSLAEAEARRAEALKDFPEDVSKAGEFYKLPENMLPEGVVVPEGAEFTPNTDLLERALPVLHQHKISPEAFHDLARAFNAYEVERFQKTTADIEADNKKLGANGPTRRKDIGDRLSALVGPDAAKFIDPNAISADAVTFFETLLSKTTSQSSVVPLNGKGDDLAPQQPATIESRWYPPTQRAS